MGEWKLRFSAYNFSNGPRVLTRDFVTEEAALREACSMRQRYDDPLSLEAPSRTYDAAAILNWCLRQKL